MKNIKINDTQVECSHEIKTDESHHTTIHVTAKIGDVETRHAMTIGAVDQPLPENYGQAELQRDLDAARQKCASMAESKLRAKQLAANLE